MVQAPSYQPAMIPAPMPVMPAMGAVPTMPGEAGLREPGWYLGPRDSDLAVALTCSGHLLFFIAMMVPPQPQPLVPSLDSRQLALQQQNFINQQAMILVRTVDGAGRW